MTKLVLSICGDILVAKLSIYVANTDIRIAKLSMYVVHDDILTAKLPMYVAHVDIHVAKLPRYVAHADKVHNINPNDKSISISRTHIASYTTH